MPTKKAQSQASVPGKRATPKARGMSLHVGLNSVDPRHYGGWSGDLVACEFDAKDMAAIARRAGMKPTTLLTRNGTRGKMLARIRSAAKQLKAGDFFFLTYSGHGGQIPDITADEQDKKDETWCLFDGELIDDELNLELSRFAKGVRVLVLSDSCHSGTVTRARRPEDIVAPATGRSKLMPPAVALRTYSQHKEFYDRLQEKVRATSNANQAEMDPDAVLASLAVSPRLTAIAKATKASVILISGCQDNQTSLDGDHNGAFTEQLLLVWNNGGFKGNYAKFHAIVKAGMPATQTPNLFTLGPSAKFVRQQPFRV